MFTPVEKIREFIEDSSKPSPWVWAHDPNKPLDKKLSEHSGEKLIWGIKKSNRIFQQVPQSIGLIEAVNKLLGSHHPDQIARDYEIGEIDESGMDRLNESGMDGLVSQYSPAEAVNPLTGETADVEAMGNPDPSDLLNETPYPWEQWVQLPKVEREAEMKEALKENYQAEEYFEADKTEAATSTENKCEWVITTYPVPPYGHGSWVCPQKNVNPVTGETVGNSDTTATPPFPYWDVAEATTETEFVGGHFFDTAESEAAGEISTPFMNQAEAATDIVDGYPIVWSELPNLFDQSATIDKQWDEHVGCSYADKVTKRGNREFDTVTRYALNNDDAASFDWFQIHHDDGIMDGYLDTVETANRDMIITEFPELPLGQAITFEESRMDGLVAAGPFDAVALNEPQTNNVF